MTVLVGADDALEFRWYGNTRSNLNLQYLVEMKMRVENGVSMYA